MPTNSKARTTDTYDHISESFHERNRDRTRVGESMDRFTRHLRRGGLVLDVGCGPGFDAELLRDRGFRVVGVELYRAMLRLGKGHFPGWYVRADMERPPFSAVADGLWVNASFLHAERGIAGHTLGELYHLLRPAGVLFLGVKEGAEEGWECGWYESTLPRWFTYWKAPDLERSLQDVGFRIVDIWSNGTWLKVCAIKRD